MSVLTKSHDQVVNKKKYLKTEEKKVINYLKVTNYIENIMYITIKRHGVEKKLHKNNIIKNLKQQRNCV